MLTEDYIIGSGLSQEDKDLWFVILAKLTEDQVKVLEGLVLADDKEESLRSVTLNIRSKLDAFQALDEKALEEIVKQEETLL